MTSHCAGFTKTFLKICKKPFSIDSIKSTAVWFSLAAHVFLYSGFNQRIIIPIICQITFYKSFHFWQRFARIPYILFLFLQGCVYKHIWF